jgi:myo-inositol-1(or 4)-monophosphatase
MEKPVNLKRAQATAVGAARAVGALMRRELRHSKVAQSATQHDIKLELDVRSQKLIEKMLHLAFPQVGVLGEEGDVGATDMEYRWVVDPIDGTVNFAYCIPHACVSIALQRRDPATRRARGSGIQYEDGYVTLLGVVYDPFCDELWTAIRGQPALLNGRPIHVSRRRKLDESIVSIGFAKSVDSIDATLPYFNKLVYRVRKIRMMGAAALGLTYVATGRFDAYIESNIRLWDIAAGGLIIECAGGEFWRKTIAATHGYRVIATNGLLRRTLRVPEPPV